MPTRFSACPLRPIATDIMFDPPIIERSVFVHKYIYLFFVDKWPSWETKVCKNYK